MRRFNFLIKPFAGVLDKIVTESKQRDAFLKKVFDECRKHSDWVIDASGSYWKITGIVDSGIFITDGGPYGEVNKYSFEKFKKEYSWADDRTQIEF